eukprot:2045765-Ditylum_brightwellii.AAC.1
MPQYVTVSMNKGRKETEEVLQLVEDGVLRIVLCPTLPFLFTEYGVKDAFCMQSSGHAHGWVVIAIQE